MLSPCVPTQEVNAEHELSRFRGHVSCYSKVNNTDRQMNSTTDPKSITHQHNHLSARALQLIDSADHLTALVEAVAQRAPKPCPLHSGGRPRGAQAARRKKERRARLR